MPEIHVGDIGTRYRARVKDEGGDFDPSGATVKELRFLMRDGLITKEATVSADGSPPTAWYLEYVVTEGDGLGSPPGEFHATAGPLKIQAYLEWPGGSIFHSDVRSVDEDGNELRIFENLT